MSLKYLGDTLDIHGGGQDLIFPHHENEIAQSESFTGVKPFAKYWLHNGMVQLGEEKMSKSLGNLITIKEALDKDKYNYGPDALRIFVLNSHYRSPLTYSEEVVEAAKRGAERLRRVMVINDMNTVSEEALDAEPYRKQFIEAMDDDFNTAQAVATLFDLVREINRADEAGLDVSKARETLRELAGVLGLTFKEPEEPPLDAEHIARVYTTVYQDLGRVPAYNEKSDAETMIFDLVDVRKELRKAKQWQQADMVRDKLDEAGIVIMDLSGEATTWRRKN